MHTAGARGAAAGARERGDRSTYVRHADGRSVAVRDDRRRSLTVRERAGRNGGRGCEYGRQGVYGFTVCRWRGAKGRPPFTAAAELLQPIGQDPSVRLAVCEQLDSALLPWLTQQRMF